MLGLVGTNGIGKSTALNILAGKLKPNLGNFDVSIFLINYLVMKFEFYLCIFLLKNPPDWAEITTYFRGSTLQSYFTRLVEDNLKSVIKPQYVDQIPRVVKVT